MARGMHRPSPRLRRAAFTCSSRVVVVVFVGLVLFAASGHAAIPMPPISLDQLKVVAAVTFTAPPDFKPISYTVTSYHWGTRAEIFDFRRQGARTVAYWDFEKEKVQYWRTGLDQRLSALATSDEIYPIMALFTPYGVYASELAAMRRKPDAWKYEVGVAPGEQAWQRFILDRIQLPAEAGQEPRAIEFQSKRRIVFREGKLVEVLGTLYSSEAGFRVTYTDHDEKNRLPRRAVAELKGPGGGRSPAARYEVVVQSIELIPDKRPDQIISEITKGMTRIRDVRSSKPVFRNPRAPTNVWSNLKLFAGSVAVGIVVGAVIAFAIRFRHRLRRAVHPPH
ncbi:MAG: hypothetical protein KatS3mg130_0120 [Candidatus Sumerlaea sp.]|nr:hypothetical protein [Candidatus Sumerlaea chitinivorans]GIX43712.1 MAG: hypothetical protein KatS3mg130_0120 [Candidatus Sumerlaea sp.]